MKILALYPVMGPNVFNHRSIMVMRLHLEDLAGVDSHEVPGFIDRLLAMLPGLKKHRCSRLREGGFVARLREGTYFGHVIEHVALELSDTTCAPAYFGKTVHDGAHGIYKVVIECDLPSLSHHLLTSAVSLVEAAVKGEPFNVAAAESEARRIADRVSLGPSTKAVVDAAERRGIPVRRVNEGSLIQLGYGKHRQYVQATEGWQTRSVAVDIACDKALTKTLLEQASVPVPWGVIARSRQDAVDAVRKIGRAAVKPLDGHHGDGVFLNVSTPEEAASSYEAACDFGTPIIVEEMFEGRDYRVLVVGGRLVAASERVPPSVVGDGVRSIRALVEEANRDPRRGEGHEKPLSKIPMDEGTEACLAHQGHAWDDVLPAGTEVRLRENANISTGGIARDVTDLVHPRTKRICERAAEAVGLDICGIDLLADDISQPLGPGNGIIEVNAAPGIRMHHYPAEGRARDVGDAIVELMFPKGADGRIPIVAVTGTNGKTTVTRMVAQVMREAGKRVGMTTTGGIWVGDEMVAEGDTTGPRSARTVLSDPTVEAAVLETARGGLTRHGLGYDWADVAVMTNIQTDHIGQDGIESEEDLFHVKSLVAERVREGGTVVLNAADERLLRLPSERRMAGVTRRYVLFAQDPELPAIRRHLEAGGTAYYVRRGWVVEAVGRAERVMVPIASVPITMGGAAAFQVENVLAAVAACRAQGLGRMAIGTGLASFGNADSNPGRVNLYRLGKGHVLVDYGHNPSSFTAISTLARQWSPCVTGVVAVPGDRCDAVIAQAARAAAEGFDRLVIKEDRDLRGRAPGEVPKLVQGYVQEFMPAKECRIVPDEIEALTVAVESMQEGETVVIFYEELAPVRQWLEERGAIPARMNAMGASVAEPADVTWENQPLMTHRRPDGIPPLRVVVAQDHAPDPVLHH